jgi:hypothetical protein
MLLNSTADLTTADEEGDYYSEGDWDEEDNWDEVLDARLARECYPQGL